MNKQVRDYTSSETKAVDDERKLVVTISTKNPDRSNDIMEPGGAIIDNYLKNPIVLYAHDYKSHPIAKASNLTISADSISATVEFPTKGKFEQADLVYDLYKEGLLNAWSIGFVPKEWAERKDETGYGYTFTKWELLEFSAVPVPDNPEALTMLRSKGISEDVIEKLKTFTPDVKPEEKRLEKKGEEPEVKEISNITLDESTKMIKIDFADGTNIKGKGADGIFEFLKPELKAGRTISKKNESLLKQAAESITTVLSSLGEEEEGKEAGKETEKDKPVDNEFLLSLQKELRKTDKEVGLNLRSLNDYLKNSKKPVQKEG